MSSSRPRRSFRLQRFGLFIAVMVISLATGIAIGVIASVSDIPFPGFAGFLGLWLVVYYVSIALHEAGHFLAARYAGLSPHIMVVGPLRLTWEEEGVQAHLDRTFLAGGLVIARPKDGRMLPRQMAWMIGGGPGASVITTGVGLLIAFAWPSQSPEAGPLTYVPTFSFLLGSMSGLLGVVALFPTRAGGFLSDGGRLLRLWRGGPNANRDAVIWSILALMYGPDRLRNVPAGLLVSAMGLHDDSQEECQAHALGYSVALDQGDVAGAASHLDRAHKLIHTMPKAVHPALYLEVCYFAARHEQDAEKARAAFAKTQGGLGIQKWTRLRAESALALVKGDTGRADSLAREGLGQLAKKPKIGMHLFETALLEDILAQASVRESS